MKMISQRELRNETAEVIRSVERGESYTVTLRGVPVARLVPVRAAPDLRRDRPAKKRAIYTERPRVRASTATSALLDNLRRGR